MRQEIFAKRELHEILLHVIIHISIFRGMSRARTLHIIIIIDKMLLLLVQIMTQKRES